jgi:hypothetical protein
VALGQPQDRSFLFMYFSRIPWLLASDLYLDTFATNRSDKSLVSAS